MMQKKNIVLKVRMKIITKKW